ncbi:MAG: FAD:protein FMN transferase [Nitrospira sp.]|nr:MAG: FAD:protein FMN transferase [Nitrospira sp.]
MTSLCVWIRRFPVGGSFALALLFLWSCGELKPEASIPATDAPTIVRRAQMHMGTVVTLTAVAPTASMAQQAVEAGFGEVRRLEALLSTWIPTSELSKVNAAAGRAPVPVGPESLLVLKRSLEIALLTEGGFNIALGPAIEAWSVTEQARIPTEAELRAIHPLVELSALHINERAGTVYLERAGMRVDVGGIGKGFAADLAATVMQRAGATAGVVALSGDIKTFGRLPDKARFRFGIQHPRDPGRMMATLELENEAISTAGDYERYFERNGVRYHHILDPRTLQPARSCQSVTIVAKEGVMADGLDTGIFVMGPERGMALIEQLPDVEGVIVDAEGRVLVSSGLRERVRPANPTISPLPN